MKIGILTSSRADFGIYLPLLNNIKENRLFDIEIIVFGTHLSKSHGFTVKEIESIGFSKIHKISSLISNDDEESIATSYGLTVIKFVDFWAKNKFELVFCLGDRFEMSAAVQAGIPFGIKYAHLHGGETTLGAIDNIYRHQISHASFLHFTASDIFTKKVIELLGTSENVFTVGSLSLAEIHNFRPSNKIDFLEKYKIPKEDFILATFHPETNAFAQNLNFAIVMRNVLYQIAKDWIVVITMPNADTLGNIYRDEILKIKSEHPDRFICIENFGKENYFNAMHYSKLMIGNTSSGIIEAASFRKFVVNIGDRQKGRAQSDNIINVKYDENEIISKFNLALGYYEYKGDNIYCQNNTIELIVKELKSFYETL
jgi:GDP/UDP-N,N'-diacetylbacillosamine 2-epimerase (hydrolysing)